MDIEEQEQDLAIEEKQNAKNARFIFWLMLFLFGGATMIALILTH